LNVLKYTFEEEDLIPREAVSTAKSFKMRKVYKKFDEVKVNKCQLFKTNLGILKENRSPSPKIRYRTVGCASKQ
jgi:hypothetical protein